MRNSWLQRNRHSSPFSHSFKATSIDPGYLFDIDVEGYWEQLSKQYNHNAESVALSYVIEQIEGLASKRSLVEHARLQHRANSLLGQPVDLGVHGIRVCWAAIHASPPSQDIEDLLTTLRHRASVKQADEEMRLKIERITTFRNALREDSTLALAQMLLERPDAVSSDTLTIVNAIASFVAAHAPGAGAVAIAQVLRDFAADLKPDAKQFITDRLCTVLIEFGGVDRANQIRTILGREADARASSP